MKDKEEIEQRYIVPTIAMISAGKSKFLNVIYNIDYLQCTTGIGTKFVNLLRYNPKIKEPRFYHLKLEKKEEIYIFYKDLTKEEYEGGDKIKEEIENINSQLRAEPQINYEDLFYMTEINQSQFIKDEKYLLTHDLCDIPGLSESQKNNKEEKEEKNKIIEEKEEKNKIIEEKEEKNKIIEVKGEKEETDKEFKKIIEKESKNYRLFSIINEEKEEKEENEEKDKKEKENKVIEDDIYKKLDKNEKNTYLTEIFKIIKNRINGGIIILNQQNYFMEENFKIIAKLHKVLGKEITDFLVILNKIDLSINPKVDIENCKGMLIQNFQKFQAFNLNLNTFIPLSLNQVQNELLMSTSFKYPKREIIEFFELFYILLF